MAYVGSQVVLGDDVILYPNAYVTGDTHVGQGTTIFSFAVVGEIPQDIKFANEKTKTIIGVNNTIREFVTIHAGTEGGGGVTKIGNNNLIMVGVHVAHDAIIHNSCILVNNTIIAGHVEVDDFAVIGGGTGVHQFVHIGQHAMIGGMSAIERDVVPYSLTMSERSKIVGLNIIGLKRRGFNKTDVMALKAGMKEVFFGGGDLQDRLNLMENEAASQPVSELVEFVRNSSRRGLTQADINAKF